MAKIWIDVEAKIKWETDKAWRVENEKTPKDKEVWIPKEINGTEIECDEGEGGWAVFTLPEWLAAEKELV